MSSEPQVARATNPAALTSPPPAPFISQATTRITAAREAEHADPGVTPRVALLCLVLAAIFGFVIPIIDVKLANTFLGAAHLPPGAIAVLLVLLLVVNPLAKLLAQPSQRGVLWLGAAGCGVLAYFAFHADHAFAGWLGVVLAGLLALVGVLAGRALSRNETLVVYISCLFSCLVPGHGAENFFVSNLIGPFYFATRENKWLEFLGGLKPWFTPALAGGPYAPGSTGYTLVQQWYTGIRVGNQFIPWGAWAVSLAAWGSLIFASYLMLGCLGVILRAQWAEREALTFPLLRLPLELTEDVNLPASEGVIGRFFRNPLMWVGFGITVTIQLIRGLHVYYADVPDFPLQLDLVPYFSEPPFNQIGKVLLFVFPLVIGITYLLTSEISFSMWFFFWGIRFQLIAAYMLGFLPMTMPTIIGHSGGAKTFNGFQQFGAYLAYAAVLCWTGREHIGHIVRRAFGRERATEGEHTEALSYPVAFWGFVGSFAFIIAWTIAAGLSPLVAFLTWGMYLVIALALTRLVVEGGLLFVQQGWVPLSTLAQLVNAGPGTLLPPSTLVPGTFLQASLMTDMRSFVLPSFLQSFKLAHDSKIKARPLFWLIIVILLLTLAQGIYMRVAMGYNTTGGGLGLESWFAQSGAQQPALNAKALMGGVQQGVTWTNWLWIGVGVLATLGMMAARARFLWFPLHPLGYLMCLTYPMNGLWFSVFLGWALKGLVTRFGGTDTYRKTTPLFLGLALGDVTMMLVWLAIDGALGRTHHQLMPG